MRENVNKNHPSLTFRKVSVLFCFLYIYTQFLSTSLYIVFLFHPSIHPSIIYVLDHKTLAPSSPNYSVLRSPQKVPQIVHKPVCQQISPRCICHVFLSYLGSDLVSGSQKFKELQLLLLMVAFVKMSVARPWVYLGFCSSGSPGQNLDCHD